MHKQLQTIATVQPLNNLAICAAMFGRAVAGLAKPVRTPLIGPAQKPLVQ